MRLGDFARMAFIVAIFAGLMALGGLVLDAAGIESEVGALLFGAVVAVVAAVLTVTAYIGAGRVARKWRDRR